jgi:hypothetical protein
MNQDGVDEATGKLTQILHRISDKAYYQKECLKKNCLYSIFFCFIIF